MDFPSLRSSRLVVALLLLVLEVVEKEGGEEGRR